MNMNLFDFLCLKKKFVFILYIDLWPPPFFSSLQVEEDGEKYLYGWWWAMSIVKEWRDKNPYIANAFVFYILVKLLC